MGEAQSNTLDSIELLRALSAGDRARISKECVWRRFGAGEQILEAAQYLELANQALKKALEKLGGPLERLRE